MSTTIRGPSNANSAKAHAAYAAVRGPLALPRSSLVALNNDYGPEKSTTDVKQKTIRADAKGYFDLAALHGAAGNNSASYMYAEFESPLDQDADIERHGGTRHKLDQERRQERRGCRRQEDGRQQQGWFKTEHHGDSWRGHNRRCRGKDRHAQHQSRIESIPA